MCSHVGRGGGYEVERWGEKTIIELELFKSSVPVLDTCYDKAIITFVIASVKSRKACSGVGE